MQVDLEKWISAVIPWLLTHGIRILLAVVIGLILYKILSRIIDKAVRVAVVSDATTSVEAEVKRENTLIRIFTGALKIILLTIISLMILQEFGFEIGPILAGAGIVGLAVGFGGQYLIKDIISGFFIILENQYRVGDVVKIDGTSGLVEDVTIRMTTLRDMDGTVHHVPHGSINQVSNMSKHFSRVNLNIGVSYSSNIEHVIEVVNRVGNALAEDALWKDAIISAPHFLRIDDFADSAIIIKIVGETKPIRQWEVTGELRKRIKMAFDSEGIEIPFPQRVIHTA